MSGTPLTLKLPWLLWAVAAALLLIGTMHLPYGYYTFLRLAICAFGAVLTFAEAQRRPIGPTWAVAFALLALVFNPVIPVYLKRDIWFFVDLIAAAFICAHLISVRFLQKA
jgi:hypothetical protein